MNKKDLIFLRILEICWIVIAISSLITCIDTYQHYGFNKDAIMFGVFTLVSVAMYIYRLKKRKNAMKNSKV